MSDFANRLKELRILHQFTQSGLADKFGVSQNAIFNWETGKRFPNIDMVERMADFFDVTPAYLMGWESGVDFTVDFENIPGQAAVSYQSTPAQMLRLFRCLNGTGRQKAIEHLELLNKIPEYKISAEDPR